jgi:Helix-turn-helix.
MTTWLEKRLARSTGATGLETERLLIDLTETFAAEMETKEIKRAELARRMGVDRAVVTRVMAGDRNVTLRTLVAVASNLGCRLHVTIEDASANPVVERVPAPGIADVVSMRTAKSRKRVAK